MFDRRLLMGVLCVTGLIALGCGGMGDGSPGSSGGDIDKEKLRVGASDIKKGDGSKKPSADKLKREHRKHEYTVKLKKGVKGLKTKKGTITSTDKKLSGAFSSVSVEGAAAAFGKPPKNSKLSEYLGLDRTLTFTSKRPKAKVLAKLEAHPDVEWVEPVVTMRRSSINDPYYAYQWHMQNLKVEEAWKVTKGKGVVVAVVDTGVSVGEDGFFKMAPGYDFVDDDTTPQDGNQHGSHVAGTIAQKANNNIGVVGVAPEATIMPIRVLGDDGGGSNTWVANGIIWAVDHGANIINLSLGSSQNSEVVADACAYAYEHNVTVIAATGNDGYVDYIGYPAALPTTIAVGSVDAKNVVAFYSNQGKEIDLVAPGGDSGVDTNNDGMGDGVVQETVENGKFGYYFLQGTSMATPHVAGLAALLYAQGVKRPDAIRKIMANTADDLGGKGWDSTYGNGMINPVKALSKTKKGAAGAASASSGLEINNARVKRVSSTRAVVGWKTTVPSSTMVRGSDGTKTKDGTMVSMHKFSVKGTKGQKVTYNIKSIDENGKEAKKKLTYTF